GREPPDGEGEAPCQRARVVGGPAELGEKDVRVLLGDHLVAGLTEGAERDLVRHRRSRDEDRFLQAEELRSPPLELVDGRVLALLLVADLGGRDRRAHLGRGSRLRVRAEIDHQTPFGASTPAGAGSAERSGWSSKW